MGISQTKYGNLVDAVESAYEKCGYRQCKHGHEVFVQLGVPRVDTRLVRGEKYSRRSQWNKMESRHYVYVNSSWLDLVLLIGLDTLGGRLVLSAKFYGVSRSGLPMMDVESVYQSAGTSLDVVREFAILTADGWVIYKRATHGEVIKGERFAAADMIREAGYAESAADQFDRVADLVAGVRQAAK